MEGVNYGSFLNEFAANLIPALAVFAAMFLPVFSIFYNGLMDRLSNRSEHTSLYVAIGVLVTLAVGGLFSWKAMALNVALFALSGLPMIIGEFRRTEKKIKKHIARRKRLPYAANGRIDDATMAVNEASRLLGMCLRERNETARALQLATASHEIDVAHKSLLELKLIQQIEE